MDLHPEDQYYYDNFNTKLSPEEETKFQSWAKDTGKNPELDTIDYDLRGAWKKGAELSGNGHLTDEFKKPNHISFSDESKYHNAEAPFGKYVGGKWSDNPKSFTPSITMLKHTHNVQQMKDYFSKHEPDYKLKLPAEFR